MTLPAVPSGFHQLTPSLNLSDAAAAVDFYKAAFGAIERYRMPGENGTVMHGELQIGDSVIMFCDEAPAWGALSPKSVGGCPLSLNLFVVDCDAATARAVEAGATILRAPATYPWGERSAMISDPFGFRWALMTFLEEVTPEEVQRRLQTWNPETGTW